MRYCVIRGARDMQGVVGRRQSRSKYGAEKPSADDARKGNVGGGERVWDFGGVQCFKGMCGDVCRVLMTLGV